MKNSNHIETNRVVFSMITEKEREKDDFLSESMLVLQVSGKLTMETSIEKISTLPGNILLMRKYQLVKVSKMPFDGEDFSTIIILLNDDVLRKYALKEKIEINEKYKGKSNIFISQNEYLKGFFKSLIPYGNKTQKKMSGNLNLLKVEEAIELLLYSMPELRTFLFDFSDPYKIDLEKFMTRNFHFNVPVEKFAQLTGRSLAGFKRDFQKTFNAPPRNWLQNKRLTEARYQIEKKSKKPSEIYLELGFESLSHFSNAFKSKFGVAPTELL